MDTKLIAFVRIGKFPFLAGGEISRIGKLGIAYTKELGSVYPEFILEYEEGTELMEKLSKLESDRMKETSETLRVYNQLASDLANIYHKRRNNI